MALCASAVAQETPAKVADLSRWKLTLPTDANGDGKADEVHALAGYSNPPWFQPTPEGLLFRANAGGARTSGSTAYARSELRETPSWAASFLSAGKRMPASSCCSSISARTRQATSSDRRLGSVITGSSTLIRKPVAW